MTQFVSGRSDDPWITGSDNEGLKQRSRQGSRLHPTLQAGTGIHEREIRL